MKIRHVGQLSSVWIGLLAVACTSTALATASSPQSGSTANRQEPEADRVTVPLTDPSRPARIDVSIVNGSITVRGANRTDVLVTVRRSADRPTRRVDPDATGMRRLPQSGGFRISEEGNRVHVRSDNPSRSISFEIEAPARTHLKLSTVNGGELLVENVEGDHELANTNGGITLNSVAGSVIAGTTNGSVRATLTRVSEQKEMAFTSLNGAVDVTLPPTTKANLRLRSDRGGVFTDFDVQLASSAPVVEENRSRDGRFRVSRSRSVVGSINGGGPMVELRTFNSNVYVRKGR